MKEHFIIVVRDENNKHTIPLVSQDGLMMMFDSPDQAKQFAIDQGLKADYRVIKA